jgi:predicted Zn-dependent protease
VIKMELQINAPAPADAPSDRRAQRATYDRLPEATKEQAIDKISAAMVLKEHDEAIRLLDAWRAKLPADYDLTRTAVRVYRALGQPAKAIDAADAALRANPSDPRLQILRRQVDAAFGNPPATTRRQQQQQGAQ